MKRTSKPSLTSQVTTVSKTPVEQRQPTCHDTNCLVPTGSTILNCACADNPWAGFSMGRMVNIIGDSSAGKTLLALTCLAEVARETRLRNYKLIYDDAEEALGFDLQYMFGKTFAKRLERLPQPSVTAEDFQANVLRTIDKGKPFVYVIDSFDALTTKEELEKAYLKALASAKTDAAVKEIKDAHKARKAGIASETLRIVCSPLKQTESVLLVISQTRRDRIGVRFGSKKTRSGGRALKFYAYHEMWLAVKKTHKRREQTIGIDGIINVSKNKVTGKRRKVEMPIFDDYGVDDLRANVAFLLSVGHWKKKRQTIIAPELDFEGSRNRLIRTVEKNNLEPQVKELVGQAWVKQEEGLRTKRKPRFAD